MGSPVGAASGRLMSPVVRSTASVQKKLSAAAGIQSLVCSGYLLSPSRPEECIMLHTRALLRSHSLSCSWSDALMFSVGTVNSNLTVSAHKCLLVCIGMQRLSSPLIKTSDSPLRQRGPPRATGGSSPVPGLRRNVSSNGFGGGVLPYALSAIPRGFGGGPGRGMPVFLSLNIHDLQVICS